MSRREIPIAPANGAPGPVFGQSPGRARLSSVVTAGLLVVASPGDEEISVVFGVFGGFVVGGFVVGGVLKEVLGEAEPVVWVSVGWGPHSRSRRARCPRQSSSDRRGRRRSAG